MKIIKVTLTLLLAFFIASSQAQTWSVTDIDGAIQKGVSNGQLTDELVIIGKQNSLLKLLHEQEKDFNDRRTVKANFKSTPMMLATINVIEVSEKQIDETERKIKKLKAATITRLRLQKLESQLKMEERYLKEVRSEYKFLIPAMLLSGGPGYNYTTFLKVLIRTLKIRRNILSIEYEVNNLITVNKTFKK
ncbi:hypothetical protein [Fulvivirga sediminis]|uniref:DUF4141 domain-containing protein n=1 Tax=Fulvivirga sediminis TaxID=2803949 RepID=A0A937K2Z8_9BACT|nr:hypothetical protein [Fulvivirga sediminis]MBL3658407.1 hypothetical protein [Fulvivirga sediminis]